MAFLLCAWSLLALMPACLLALPALLWQKMHYTPALARLARRLITGYGRVTLWLLRPWMPVRVDNAHAALEAAPCIIVANHQSFLDLYLLGAQAATDLCLVSKSWPYRLLFFFAPMMRLAGYVDVERLSAPEAGELCLRRLREGATLVFFPEGSRTRDGRLGRFHAGAFVLAAQAGVPVAPLLIYNSREVFPAGGRLFCPASVRMRLLDAVHAVEFDGETLPHRAMMRRVRDDFVRHLRIR